MMKFATNENVEVDVVTLQVDVEPRYWEDAVIDGVAETDADPRMPMRNGSLWQFDVDLATGVVRGWPAGVSARSHYKVCDAGIYRLLDAGGRVVAEKAGYAPNMLSSGNGGDYVIAKIGPDGMIEGWEPDLDYFRDRKAD